MTANDLVKGILNDISIKVYQGKEYSGGSTTRKKRGAILLCGSNHNRPQVLKSILQAGLDEGSVTVLITRSGEMFFSAKDFEGKTGISRVLMESQNPNSGGILKQIDWLWCPNITQASLAKLATGITDTMAVCTLWAMLAAQKPVRLTVDGVVRRAEALPQGHPMRQLMDRHLQTAESFGATLETGYDPLKAEVLETAEPKNQKAVRLIHEGNLNQVAEPNQQLILTKGQIITPAARDLAKSRNIEILWK